MPGFFVAAVFVIAGSIVSRLTFYHFIFLCESWELATQDLMNYEKPLVKTEVLFCNRCFIYCLVLLKTKIQYHRLLSKKSPTLNLERRLDHDGHPLPITTVEAVAANGVSP